MKFIDLFASQSKEYAQFRPHYPQGLFTCLANICVEHDAAWDAGTGNGQAACTLAQTFKKVYASDPSPQQLAQAASHPQINFFQAAELAPNIASHSIDIITVAQALHWFDLAAFYKEVERVAKPGGVFAAWSYDFNMPIQEDIDVILRRFYFETLGPYWAPNNKLIWGGYRDLYFPFERTPAPNYTMEACLNLIEFIGYLSSWSATQKYIQLNQTNPLDLIYNDLAPLWGDVLQKRTLKWKIHLLVGKIT